MITYERPSGLVNEVLGGSVERLSIKTPGDFISLMGHTLGYWPRESLVCVTLDGRRVGATLRVDLPVKSADRTRFVRDVADYIGADREATGVVFGIFSREPWDSGLPRPHEDTIERLTQELADRGFSVRDGWYVGDTYFANYLTTADQPLQAYPLDHITSSELNAELVFRGSSVHADPEFHLPVLAQRDLSEDVVEHCRRIEAMDPPTAITEARNLWRVLLTNQIPPTDTQAAELLADFKFISVRDRLLADIPGLDDRLGDLLLAQTKRAPHWHRVDRAEQLLLHLYTRADTADVAPVLTSLGIIQWWEGKGTRAHQCFEKALDADPTYRLAQLGDQWSAPASSRPGP